MCNDDNYAHELSDGALAARLRGLCQRMTEALMEAGKRNLSVRIQTVDDKTLQLYQQSPMAGYYRNLDTSARLKVINVSKTTIEEL